MTTTKHTRTLYLMRHAKSSWDFEELSDHDRPLNKRGRTDAPRMGKALATRDIELNLILSSSAVRALTTATLVAKELNYPIDNIAIDENIYRAGKTELLDILAEVPYKNQHLMLVGHNYALTELANLLSPEPIPNIPTAGIVCLKFSSESWASISKENATLLFFDYPKNYK